MRTKQTEKKKKGLVNTLNTIPAFFFTYGGFGGARKEEKESGDWGDLYSGLLKASWMRCIDTLERKHE